MKVLGAESTVASSRQVACSGLSHACTSSAGNSASRRSRQRGQASIRSVLHNDGAASRIRIRARNGRGNKGTGRLPPPPDGCIAAACRIRTRRAEGGRPRFDAEIGRAHVRTPVTNAHLVCRLLLEKKNKQKQN